MAEIPPITHSFLDPERAEAGDAAAGRPLPRWFPTLFALLDRLESGSVEVCLPDGRRFTARGARGGLGNPRAA